MVRAEDFLHMFYGCVLLLPHRFFSFKQDKDWKTSEETIRVLLPTVQFPF